MPDLNNTKSKHLKSFWPLVIILVVAFILCGLILYAANNNINQDEVNSADLAPASFLQRITPHSSSKTPVKKSTSTK